MAKGPDFDYNFIRRAEKVTSFNVSAADFQTLKHKKELQHLFIKHMFPGFDLDDTIKGTTFTKASVNRVIGKLKQEGDVGHLHKYNLKGVGPGEVLMYFILDKGMLGGGSSAGLDLSVGSKGYELKAIKTTNGFFSDFKLGGTVNLDPFKTRLNQLRSALKLGGTATEISGSRMSDMKRMAPDDYNLIEEEFRTVAYNEYFRKHDVIFINNTAGRDMGNVEDIRRVKKEDIFMERVTSGTLKPLVKI